MINTGLFNWFKPKTKPSDNQKVAYTQAGYAARFSKFGDNVYNSDTVQQAIAAIAKEMKKLDPRHVREKDGSKQLITGDIYGMLQCPNEYMTTSDFIEKCIWLLYLQFNCYILPTYEIATDDTGRLYKKYLEMYPLNPYQVTYYEDANGNISYIEFLINRRDNNIMLRVPYSDIIHLRLNYSLNDYEGGDKYGKPNNEALLKTLKINHVLLESVGKGIETSYSVNGIVKYNTMLGGDKMEKSIQEFNEALKNSESGILGIDMKSEFTPITRDIKMVDKDTLEFLDLKVLRNYGVPIEVLNGTATPDQKRAWYETTLEPLIVMFNQAFTKKLFTRQKINGGNKIEFYFNRTETMTNQQKNEFVTVLGDRGALTNNQMLEVYGLPPYEGGDVRLMSLNYINVDIANQYQLNNEGVQTSETEPENEPKIEDKETNDNLLSYAKKMLLKAGLSEEEADKILEENDNEET